MLPRFRPHLTLTEIVRRVGSRSGAPGPLERAFAETFKLADAIWFPYARVAIQAWVETVGVKAVVVSPFNCLALGNGIVAGGAKPLYVDTEPGGFNQDLDQTREALGKAGAAVLVSLWGIPCAAVDTEKPILWDHALRGLDTASAPKLRQDDGVVYSLGWGKPLSSQRGAIFCGGSPDLNARLRAWRDQRVRPGGWVRDFGHAAILRLAFSPSLFGLAAELDRRGAGTSLSGKQTSLMPGDWNLVPSDAVFEFGRSELRDLPRAAAERAAQIAEYPRLLEGLTLPPGVSWLSHYAVRHPDRDAIAERMRKRGFFVSKDLFSSLLCDYPALAGERAGDLSRARELTRTTFHLPLYQGLTRDQQARVAEALKP